MKLMVKTIRWLLFIVVVMLVPIQGNYRVQAASPQCNPISNAAFTPDGKSILLIGRDGQSSIWSEGKTTPYYTLGTGNIDPNFEMRITDVAMSPDSGQFLSASSEGGFWLWDAQSGKLLHAFKGDYAYDPVFTPDGAEIVSGGDRIGVWDARTGSPIRDFAESGRGIVPIAILRDGSTLVTGFYPLQFWNFQQGKLLRTVSLVGTETDHPRQLIISPEGKYALGANPSLRLWDAETGALLNTFSDGSWNPIGMAFDPAGKTFVVSDDQGATRLWDIRTGKLLRTFDKMGSFYSLALSPNGNYLLTGDSYQNQGTETVTLWDLATGSVVRSFGDDALFVSSVAFSSDGRYVLTGNSDSARQWDTESGQLVRIYGMAPIPITKVTFPEKGNVFLTLDAVARVWDTKTGVILRIFKPIGNLYDAAISPDGRYVATASDVGVYLWDVNLDKLIYFFDQSQKVDIGIAVAVIFSPSGEYMLTASGDAKLWVTPNSPAWPPTPMPTLPPNEGLGAAPIPFRIYEEDRLEQGNIISLAFSPDAQTIVSGSRYDNNVRLWDTRSARRLGILSGHTGAVTVVTVSPDGKTILSGSEDTTVRAWDRAKGTTKYVVSGHADTITGVAYSGDGQTFLTTSADGTAKLWDAQTGTQVQTLCLPAN